MVFRILKGGGNSKEEIEAFYNLYFKKIAETNISKK